MKNHKSLYRVAWSAAISLSCVANLALAASEGDGLDEIIVTANKREETLQSVPAAVTAISGETLLRDNITSLEGVADRTPGLTFAAFAAGQPEIAIRGVGTKEDGPAASDSTVVSVDDVYIAARSAQVFDLFDLERVEVLRGPQGTLYGKNSIGGSINFVTVQPTDQTRIRTTVKAGNFGRLDIGQLVSGGLTDSLFGKVAASYRSRDGYITNVNTASPFYGQKWGETQSFGYRTQLRFVPSDRLEMSLAIDGSRDDNGATNREPVGSMNNVGVTPRHDAPDYNNPLAVNDYFGGGNNPYNTLAGVEGFTKRDIFGASFRVNYNFGAATFSSISSYRQSNYNYLEDSSGLPAATAVVGSAAVPQLPPSTGYHYKVTDAVREKPKQYTQEFRVTSPSGQRLEWLGGLFGTREENFRVETINFLSIPSPTIPSSDATAQGNKGTAYAAYGQASYHVTDWYKVTVGARESYEKKDITSQGILYSGFGILVGPGLPAAGNGAFNGLYPQVAASASWKNFSWRLVNDFEIAPDMLAYASVSTGFKSGGFVGSAFDAAEATTPFKPENATNYEVGEKIELWDHRVRINTAVFRTDYKDLQVTRFFTPVGAPGGRFVTENAGKALLQGVELEYSIRPIRSIEFGGTYAYLDARYTEFTGVASAKNPTGSNYTGNHLRQSPRHSASMYAAYIYTMGSGSELSARVNGKYQSLSFYDADNNPITVVPGYHLYDARLGYASSDKHWDISAWMQNALNKQYRTHVFSQLDGSVAFALFGDPRTYGLTMTYNY